jgi:hypothetical protein
MVSSPYLTVLFYALWAATPALLICVAVVLRRRRLDKEFPFFFKYLIFQVVTNVVLFALRNHYRPYFYSYYLFQAIGTVLEFGIIYEIFGQLFRPYPYLRDFARVLLKWAGSLLLLIAVLFALTASPNEAPILVATLWAVRTVRLVQCGLVFFLLWFCPYLGITRRHYLFGVALGFGTLAASDLVGVATRMWTGYIAAKVLSLVVMAGSDWAATIWLIYFLARAPIKKAASEAVASGQLWEHGVADLLYPQAEPGLLARIDRLVEDAFAHQRDAKVASSDAPRPLQPPTPSH